MTAEDSIRSAFDAQFRAGLNMLEAAVRACPDDAWDRAEQVNRFWHIAYHTGQLSERIRQATGTGVPWVGPDWSAGGTRDAEDA